MVKCFHLCRPHKKAPYDKCGFHAKHSDIYVGHALAKAHWIEMQLQCVCNIDKLWTPVWIANPQCSFSLPAFKNRLHLIGYVTRHFYHNWNRVFHSKVSFAATRKGKQLAQKVHNAESATRRSKRLKQSKSRDGETKGEEEESVTETEMERLRREFYIHAVEEMRRYFSEVSQGIPAPNTYVKNQVNVIIEKAVQKLAYLSLENFYDKDGNLVDKRLGPAYKIVDEFVRTTWIDREHGAKLMQLLSQTPRNMMVPVSAFFFFFFFVIEFF